MSGKAGIPQEFRSVTLAQYQKMCEKAQAAGIAIKGDSGTASKVGVTVTWNYDPSSQDLRIQCLGTPFFVSMDDINEKIAAMVKAATLEG